MASLFDVLSALLRQPAPAAAVKRGSRRYECRCGRPVFFRNSVCTACHTPLGYDPDSQRLLPLEPDTAAEGLWRNAGAPPLNGAAAPAGPWRRCGNFDSAAGCNWLVPADPQGSAPLLCRACRLSRTIPDLTVPDNATLWSRIELARRRLVSQLIALRLPVASKVPAANEDPERGLMFDVLRQLPGGPPVMTGHDHGLITVNLEEADDAHRETLRNQMREPYRTLLGHFRHEVGHYYWDRLVAGTPWLDGYRALFGDERDDYGAALQRHYANGPAPDWPQRHVSGYASSHPWEDWAETWAHYLHMLDTLDTALSFGLEAADVDFEFDLFTEADLWRPKDPGAQEFLGFVNAWVELTSVLNELSRSMGQPDYYPFVLPRPVVAKLQFVHLLVQEAGRPLAKPLTPVQKPRTAAPAAS